jgi:PAS domain-containing protein
MSRSFSDDSLAAGILNAIPIPIFIVDYDVRLVAWNPAADEMMGDGGLSMRRGGDVLHCVNALSSPGGCGRGDACKTCVVRNSVTTSIQGGGVYRKRTVMEMRRPDGTSEIPLMVTTSPVKIGEDSLVILMLEDIGALMNLGSVLPICSYCKKIRLNDESWEPVDQYIHSHVIDVNFSHTFCPDCMKTFRASMVKSQP